ncbi:MAG: type IV pilus modification protein PilV [Lautropia sp.]|nr:type IV pilus modification protein PilV [Lautropia sp.]
MQMMQKTHACREAQRGSSLIEVLVAVIVLSIGMMSMLWALTKSMSFQRTAEFRNMATQFALDYSDRVRANAGAQASYVHRVPYDNGARPVQPPAKDCLNGKENCSAAEMAAYDLAKARQSIRTSLPAGEIFVESPGASQLSVWVIWQQPDQPGQDVPAGQGGVNAATSNPLSSAGQCPAGAGRLPATTQCQFLGVRL